MAKREYSYLRVDGIPIQNDLVQSIMYYIEDRIYNNTSTDFQIMGLTDTHAVTGFQSHPICLIGLDLNSC
jgi:hypothetical protein